MGAAPSPPSSKAFAPAAHPQQEPKPKAKKNESEWQRTSSISPIAKRRRTTIADSCDAAEVQHSSVLPNAALSAAVPSAAPRASSASIPQPHLWPGFVGRVARDRRIHWDGSTLQPLAVWIEEVRPSLVSVSECEWIQVANVTHNSPGFQARDSGTFIASAYQGALSEIADIIRRGGNVSSAAKQKCVRSILETASAHRYATGKWMAFVPPSAADELWAKVARATAEGELGCSAKIAPAMAKPENESILCCVYVRDCSVRSEVKRVLLALQGLGIQVKAGFKPDVFTSLGIYANNEWRLEPTLYKVTEVLAWE